MFWKVENDPENQDILGPEALKSFETPKNTEERPHDPELDLPIGWNPPPSPHPLENLGDTEK